MTSSFPAAVSKRHAVPILHDGDRKRPSFVPDNERLAIAPLIDQPPSFGSGHGEHLTVFPAGGRIRSGGQLLSVAAEDGDEFLEIACFDDAYQFSRGIVGRLERSWRILGCCRRRRGASDFRSSTPRRRGSKQSCGESCSNAWRSLFQSLVVLRDRSTTPSAAASRPGAAAAARSATLTGRPFRSARSSTPRMRPNCGHSAL